MQESGARTSQPSSLQKRAVRPPIPCHRRRFRHDTLGACAQPQALCSRSRPQHVRSLASSLAFLRARLNAFASYQPPKMPPIKGGSFSRAFHKSEIEGMMERAAGAPGPGEVTPLPVIPSRLSQWHASHRGLQNSPSHPSFKVVTPLVLQYRFEHSDIASSVKPSIRARVASSRRAYNGVGGAFGMQLIAPKKQSLKSSFCVCSNNWTCHYCTGQRVNLVSSVGTRCPTAQVRVFKDCLHPQLQNLRAVSPDRSISRTNKYLPFK